MKRPSIEIDGKIRKVIDITWYGFQENDLIDCITYKLDGAYENSTIRHRDSDKPLSELLIWEDTK